MRYVVVGIVIVLAAIALSPVAITAGKWLNKEWNKLRKGK